MKPFINCKYESIYNVLNQFKRNTTLLDFICYFRLKKENNILVSTPISKIDFKYFLKIFKIEETTIDKTYNLKQFLTNSLINYKCVVIKADLYYQKFSKKYYKKKHKKHNIFIKGIQDDKVIIIENNFADSENYIEMKIDFKELEQWYIGYLINYYNKGLDKADTIYLYSENKENYLESLMYYKIFSIKYYLEVETLNISTLIDYFGSKHDVKDELKTYTNILNYKLKYLKRIGTIKFLKIENIILDEINVLYKLQKDIIKGNEIEENRIKLIDLEHQEIKCLKKQAKRESFNIIVRKFDEYRILKEFNDIEMIIKDICDVYIQYPNIIIDLQTKSRLKKFKKIYNINFCTLSKYVCEMYKEYDKLIDTGKEKLITLLNNEGYKTECVNVQRNSINGYIKIDGKERYFFKILENNLALQELRGYFCLIGKFHISKIKEIIKYSNYSIIIFIYDKSIQQDEGLLNDFFVENDNQVEIEKDHFKIIKKIIEENLKYVNEKILREKYPMQVFFNERINNRLKVWYKQNFNIEFNNKKYSIFDIIKNIEKYFSKKRKYLCFLSQGDPNSLNLGIKPILFDYTTSGYNPLIAEFCTMMWSILFNDLYFAPKYHSNSYYNHTKILNQIPKYNFEVNYYIKNNTIKILSGKIKTTKIRKVFMIEYIKKIKEITLNKYIISKECLYFIIMRILCIFNLNEMEEKDKILSLLIMITFIERIIENESDDIFDIIEKFILDLEEF